MELIFVSSPASETIVPIPFTIICEFIMLESESDLTFKVAEIFPTSRGENARLIIASPNEGIVTGKVFEIVNSLNLCGCYFYDKIFMNKGDHSSNKCTDLSDDQ